MCGRGVDLNVFPEQPTTISCCFTLSVFLFAAWLTEQDVVLDATTSHIGKRRRI